VKPPEEGFRRDVEVVRAIRGLAGPDVKLMVDANNGYDPQVTRRFLDEVDDELFFVEEMFPEDIAQDLELKAWLAERGWKTLVADGESAGDVDHFVPYIRARAIDVLQGDIHGFGLTRLLQLSRLSAQAGIVLSPHNWGSSLGLQMQVQLGRGIPNFGIAEEDPGVLPFLEFPGYELADGHMRVPDTPGLGFVLHADRLEAERGWDWVVEEEG
jgi:L-alanine-DL-glutamate epimerase-like enolase superfamily enzyme